MTPTQDDVLHTVKSIGASTVSALAEYTGLSRTTIRDALKHLEAEGRAEQLEGSNPPEWVVTDAESDAQKDATDAFPIPVVAKKPKVAASEDGGWSMNKAELTELPPAIESAFKALEKSYTAEPVVVNNMEYKQMVLARLAATIPRPLAAVLHEIGDDLLALSGKLQ